MLIRGMAGFGDISTPPADRPNKYASYWTPRADGGIPGPSGCGPGSTWNPLGGCKAIKTYVAPAVTKAAESAVRVATNIRQANELAAAGGYVAPAPGTTQTYADLLADQLRKNAATAAGQKAVESQTTLVANKWLVTPPPSTAPPPPGPPLQPPDWGGGGGGGGGGDETGPEGAAAATGGLFGFTTKQLAIAAGLAVAAYLVYRNSKGLPLVPVG